MYSENCRIYPVARASQRSQLALDEMGDLRKRGWLG